MTQFLWVRFPLIFQELAKSMERHRYRKVKKNRSKHQSTPWDDPKRKMQRSFKFFFKRILLYGKSGVGEANFKHTNNFCAHTSSAITESTAIAAVTNRIRLVGGVMIALRPMRVDNHSRERVHAVYVIKVGPGLRYYVIMIIVPTNCRHY